MAEPTGREILMWALTNRARLDPAGEAARYGIDLNEGPVRDFNGNVFTITTASKQPLAWNSALFAVADQHSADMRTADRLFHNSQAVHEANLTAAGYSFSSWGENVSQSATLSAGFTETLAIYAQHQSLFVDTGTAGRGHRYNIMLDSYQELGVGQVASSEGATRSWITEDFGRPSAATQFLTGIAYNDNDGDKFYSVGEGRGSISVAASAGTVATGPAGYYARAASVGAQTVTFSGGDLAAPVSVSITVAAGRNVLLNLVGQSTVETSVSLTALSGVITIVGLGNLGLTLTGNAADNTIFSALGNDTLDGLGGTDSARFRGTRSQYTLTDLGGGSVQVAGPDGTDTVNNIERLVFDDQTVIWPPPGSAGSVSINDVSVTEGNSGTVAMTFTVTRTGGTAAFAINYATAVNTASGADGDYVATSGTVNFGSNANSQTISITINGDTKVEPTETFFVNLSGATSGATISDGQGVGTITNDDANVAPVITSEGGGATATLSRAENSSAVTTVTATDANSGTTLTYSIVGGGDAARFQINGSAGTLSFITAPNFEAPIDSDANNSYIVQVRASDGNLFDDQTITVNVTNVNDFNYVGGWTGSGNDPQGWYIGDFSGDNRDDILRYHSGVSGAEVFGSTGSNFVGGSSWTGVGNDAQGWYVGDFNGDNRDDIFRYNSGVSGAQVLLSTGFSFASPVSWTGAGNDSQGWYVGDFNGDGKDDILRYNAGVSGAQVFLSNGSSFAFAGGWTGAGNNGKWYVGDFNGDNRDDIFRYQPGVSGAEVFLSNGAAFVAAGSWTGASNGSQGWYVGDFNNDNRDDILRYSPGVSGAEVFLSNGAAFIFDGSWTSSGNDAQGWYVGDFNGLGASDIFRYSPGFAGADMFLSPFG